MAQIEYPNQEVKKELEALARLRKSMGEAEVKTSVLLIDLKRTLQEKLQKIDVLLQRLLAKFPTITDEDIHIITDTQKDLRDKQRLSPITFTHSTAYQLTTVTQDILDRTVEVTYTRGDNRELLTKSVSVVKE